MVWLILLVGAIGVVVVAFIAVGRVTGELEHTVAPALLEVDDSVEVVSEALPFEVSAVLSHDDVDTIIRWVLDWFDDAGLATEYGEEIGGEWVGDETVTVDEIGAVDFAVARGAQQRPSLDAVHITVVVDEFMRYLRDIGAIEGEVG